ncbi:dynamin family protein [Paenibacillaceae bacterium WGS1546]|uniref:dynamin family protein n=1 Tax=Cohnella sp. WGS1546 TaxID=3366810 RepID=UPI00372CF4BB
MNSTGIQAPTVIDERSADLDSYIEALRRMSAAAAGRDPGQAGKLAELADKLRADRLTVAFCGHFSAGKSTLVNTLCGASLLPSSPIPTSANVVTVVNGEPLAETSFRDANGTVHPSRAVPVERLHDYAADGEGVTSIRVSYPIPLLGDRMAVVDTPGVDSTDGAHRAATESALHLADVVFYVTDYNHVQSEVNFRFLRSLARWGKPTYLLVNQIDKHREDQIAFADFRESLAQSLRGWDIEPAGTLFLSLRVPEHPLSQWEQLLGLIRDLQPLATPLMLRSARRSAVYLAEQFRETLHALNEERRTPLLERLGEDADEHKLAERRVELERRLAECRAEADVRKDRVRAECDKLLHNASLTPAETREKARDALAALQPGFKAGWLASAAKTEAERQARLERLADDFNRQASANAAGHVKELLRKEARESGYDGEEMEAELASRFRPVTPEWLKERVKPGAGADGQAVLNYAAEIAAELKSAYRKIAVQWVEELLDRSRPAREEQVGRILQELERLAGKESDWSELGRLEAEEREEERALLALLPALGESADVELPSLSPVDGDRMRLALERLEARQAETAPRTENVATRRHDEAQNADGPLPREAVARLGAPQGAAEMLERAAETLSPIAGLRGVADGLLAKAERFRSKSFTIALFGAFSAGKSSFANALVGKPALPVSPNPTTATINRIVAPADAHPDGTALVTMKTAEQFVEDLKHSLRRIGIGQDKLEQAGTDVPGLLALKDPIAAADLHPRGRPHLAFLAAAAAGWSEYGPLLGRRLTTNEAEYRKFAAEERASCFVAEIDLFVDSPITRSGAVLVDTPGADSINARHTGVAFQYIKNADAVLFVTYYNHAFTEADREFLNQLGSVKDVFELDKMFFVINAADLASSAEELEAVKEHVGAQLLKHGIRKPRLFAVSSLAGLRAKETNDDAGMSASGLADFETSFRAFSEEELGGLALASANRELERVGKLLDGWLESANADAATREAKAAKLEEQARYWRAEGADNVPSAAVQPLQQEIGEQLYHLRQRLKYRFREHFQAAFHPSVLQDEGRDLKKLLYSCGEDLKRSLGEDLLQELRAAGLRLEQEVGKMAERTLGSLPGLAEMEKEGFVPEPAERARLELPLPEAFANGPVFEAKRLWSAFRSPKHFFEKEGAAKLRGELEDELFRAIDEMLAPLRQRWETTAEEALRQAVREGALAWSAQLSEFATGMSRSLLEPGEERVLADLLERWRIIGQ